VLPLSKEITNIECLNISANSSKLVFPAKFKPFPPLIYSISSESFLVPVKINVYSFSNFATKFFQLSLSQCLPIHVVAGQIVTIGFDLSMPSNNFSTFFCNSIEGEGREYFKLFSFNPK